MGRGRERKGFSARVLMRWSYRDPALLWLIAAAFVLHVTEEWLGGFPQWLAEFVATFGLVLTILGCVRFKPDASRLPSVSTSPRPIGSRRRRPLPIRL